MDFKEIYMRRCLDLAKAGVGSVAPNPMVGAVLVHEDRIIGEGFHQVFGGPHAEVNCISSVSDADRALIPFSTLYVSLEPCAHFGKTPPCANLILSEKIPNVIIGSKDPFEEVNGKGIEILKKGGVKVLQGILEKECNEINKQFFTFHRKQRPYIILKWAQTADAKISSDGPDRLMISNQYTDRLVHKWRSEEAGIMVGTNTAEKDNPQLTNRWYSGNSPVRIVIDRNLKLSKFLNLFDGSVRTIVFYVGGELNKRPGNHERIFHSSDQPETEPKEINQDLQQVEFIPLINESNLVPQILQKLFELKIMSVIIEGGAGLINSFISMGVWDEARVITNTKLLLHGNKNEGLSAPQLIDAHLQQAIKIGHDQVQIFIHNNPR